MAPQRPSTPTFRHYLQRLDTPPMSDAELSRTYELIRRGREARRRLSESSADDELGPLQAQVAAGRRATEAVVVANLRLVVAIARRYWFDGVLLDDVVQAGNVGLVRAVQTYDPDKGADFTTWLAFAIRNAIISHLAANQHAVALPRGVHGRYLQARRDGTLLPPPPGGTQPLDLRPLPLDEPSGGDGVARHDAGRPHDRIEIQEDEAPAAAEATALADEVHRLLRVLDRQRSSIVIERFGLDGAEPRGATAQAMARGVSRESIRLRFNAAMRQLNREATARRLDDWLGHHGGRPQQPPPPEPDA